MNPGAKEVIAKQSNMHVVPEDTAKWMREDGMNLMNNRILTGEKIDILLLTLMKNIGGDGI
ncbi:hypothetical protein DMH17_11235 [Raoultella planticola]|nr:hypothetical protein [Raoultella planticola]